MLENRKTLTVVLGYIFGIVMVLYCKISIVLFYILFLIIYQIFTLINKEKKHEKKFKLISIRRYSRYLKIIFSKKVLKIIFISSIIGNSVVLYQNFKYDNLYQKINDEQITCRCIVISNVQKKEYKDEYKVKVISLDGKKEKFKGTNLYISIKKSKNTELKYGQELIVKGNYVEPEVRRNYKGFDYKEYLKTLKIYGIVEAEDISIVGKNKINPFFALANKLSLKIKNNINKYFDSKTQGIVLGIILGDKSEIEKEVIEDFSESDISHILAVSGMHMAYVILILSIFFNGTIGREYGNILTSFVILLYMFITGFPPSIVRAGIAGIIVLLSENFRLRSDTWENIATSLLITCFYNPFLIESASVLLSYIGTIGIISLNKNLLNIRKNINKNLERKSLRKKSEILKFILNLSNNKIFIKLEEAFILTLSTYLAILPIMIVIFNKLPLSSILVPVIVGFFVAPTVIFAILFVIISFSKVDFILYAIVIIEKFLVNIIIKLSEIGSNLFLKNVLLVTPNILDIVCYYMILFVSIFLIKIYLKRNLNLSEMRVKNLISLLKYRIYQNKQKLISSLLVITFGFTIFKYVPKNLRIYFVDVGQGDCTLIVTPQNQKILIDGGGSLDKNFDVGKRTLVPYLLDRKIAKIDYCLISHFDVDHIGGILTVMEELKVEKVIISKQGEDSENYQEFKRIIKERKIQVIVVKKRRCIKHRKKYKNPYSMAKRRANKAKYFK